jgi:hypothetical protein
VEDISTTGTKYPDLRTSNGLTERVLTVGYVRQRHLTPEEKTFDPRGEDEPQLKPRIELVTGGAPASALGLQKALR